MGEMPKLQCTKKDLMEEDSGILSPVLRKLPDWDVAIAFDIAR